MLSRDSILKSALAQEEVEIKEWGGKVIVRELTGSERDELEATVTSDNLKGLRADIALKCCIDGKGESIFKPEDKAELAKKSAKALDRVFDVVQRLSGLTKAAEEEAEKN